MTPRHLDRRQALGLLGAAGLGALGLAGCGRDDRTAPPTTSGRGGGGPATTTPTPGTAAPASGAGLTPAMFDGAAACRLTPQQSAGPFYLDVDNIRADIREDRPGARLRVGARVVSADGCTPVRDAVFEIWHCDAGGVYSGFEQASRAAGGPGGRAGSFAGGTDSGRFLRGAQVSNADGIAEITTIYPGWYPGRTVHIHAKVLISNNDVLTTQFYFDDRLTDRVHARPPYRDRGRRDTRNADDGIFGDRTILSVREDGDGYLGLITLGVRA